jgi:hypothetical protein
MNANPEFASFARLVESLTPWLDEVVIIGGWAHRLHRFAAHLHHSFVSLFTYRSETHSPPRRAANARISLSVSGLVWVQVGHQLPLLTLVGIAFH